MDHESHDESWGKIHTCLCDGVEGEYAGWRRRGRPASDRGGRTPGHRLGGDTRKPDHLCALTHPPLSRRPPPTPDAAQTQRPPPALSLPRAHASPCVLPRCRLSRRVRVLRLAYYLPRDGIYICRSPTAVAATTVATTASAAPCRSPASPRCRSSSATTASASGTGSPTQHGAFRTTPRCQTTLHTLSTCTLRSSALRRTAPC